MIETSHIPKKWDINFISCCNIHPCNMFWIQFFDSCIVLFRPSKTIPAIEGSLSPYIIAESMLRLSRHTMLKILEEGFYYGFTH